MEQQTRQVAKTLWDFSGGQITNLRMQKLAYLCHVVSLHRHNTPLVIEGFEAWDYGPVCPELYRQMKPYGANNVANIFGKTSLKSSKPELSKIVSETFEITKS